MGMSDQYDDGRYDGFDRDEVEHYNTKTDEWLPAGDPRLPKPGRYHDDPVTAASREAYAQRPRPTKGTTMAQERLTKAQIENELRTNTQLLEELHKRRAQLQEQARKAIPAEPHTFTMFSISIQFKFRGKRYQFLILRCGDLYFTTGTDASQQKFESWQALCAWLEGPDVYSHSDLEILRSNGNAVSFTSGAIERLDKTQPPF